MGLGDPSVTTATGSTVGLRFLIRCLVYVERTLLQLMGIGLRLVQMTGAESGMVTKHHFEGHVA